MRHLNFLTALFTLLAMLTTANALAITRDEMSEQDRKKMDAAIHFMDNGMPNEAIELLTMLDKKYPGSETIMYEIVYAHTVAKQYDQAEVWTNRMLKLPNATADTYVAAGNTLDYLGKRDEALKIYNQGLKKFPESGRLLVEMGNMAMSAQDYDKAVDYFEQSVALNPVYTPAYYRLANIFSNTYDPVWAIMYAENYIVLERDNENRIKEMSKLIYDIYRENIKSDGDSMKVSLTHNITMPRNASYDCDVPYNWQFENSTVLNAIPYTGSEMSIDDVMQLRCRATEHMDTTCHDYYDVPVFKLQREALAAGHLEGYNMWLLAIGNETPMWSNDSCAARIKAFIDWFNNENKLKNKDLCGVPRLRTHVAARIDVPSTQELSDDKGCKKHRGNIKQIADWLITAPYDSVSALRTKFNHALIMWTINTSDVSLTLSSEMSMSQYASPFMAAIVDYCIENKVKELDLKGYITVMKRVLNYVRDNQHAMEIDDKTRALFDLNDDAITSTFTAEWEKIKS
ncbi:MAG: tetratricopeptide repeat protein [Bacteroidales bacterium]|nr:tetratricopeptide repeat protein [Candidatus Sodaliphilus limicaballi]